MQKNLDNLKKLREPFPINQIGKLPKPTREQTEELKVDHRKGIRCLECGGWHHPKVVHLSYIGHAALTDRLLDVDPMWSWEPMSIDEQGLPRLDKDSGMWIKLTICGMTRLGYGSADGKKGGNATKELIGDALRNAAMRFGAALDLWHKGILHMDIANDDPIPEPMPDDTPVEKPALKEKGLSAAIASIKTGDYSVKSLKSDYKLTSDQLILISDELKGFE